MLKCTKTKSMLLILQAPERNLQIPRNVALLLYCLQMTPEVNTFYQSEIYSLNSTFLSTFVTTRNLNSVCVERFRYCVKEQHIRTIGSIPKSKDQLKNEERYLIYV